MENQNKKCRAKYEKDERKRIFNMTETAYSNDPRIKRQKEAEEAERQAIKAAKKERK